MTLSTRILPTEELARLEEIKDGSVATTAISDDIRRLLEHVQATKLDGDHYMVSVEGE